MVLQQKPGVAQPTAVIFDQQFSSSASKFSASQRATRRETGAILLARQKRVADHVEPGEQRQAQLWHMIAPLRTSEKAFA